MDTEFVAPGPGYWQLDRSHFTGGTTPIMRWLLPAAVGSAYRKQWPLMGIPATAPRAAMGRVAPRP